MVSLGEESGDGSRQGSSMMISRGVHQWMMRDSQSAHCPAHPTDYTIVKARGVAGVEEGEGARGPFGLPLQALCSRFRTQRNCGYGVRLHSGRLRAR